MSEDHREIVQVIFSTPPHDLPNDEGVAVMIKFCARKLVTLPSILKIAMLYSLTNAESRLVRELCLGNSLKQARNNLGVAEGTVRQRLKAVFEKTQIHSQPQLVAHFLSHF